MFSTLAHLFVPRHTNNHRPRLIHPEGLIVLTALVFIFNIALKQLLPLTPAGKILGYASSITVNQVLDNINKERIKAGETPLKLNDKLTQAANAKATNMFNEQYWAHTSPTGKTPWVFVQNAGYQYSVAGENLARDFGDTPSMITAWMASPTHQANILQKKYVETGIAVVDGKLGGVETTLVIQLFGTPSVLSGSIVEQGSQTRGAQENIKQATNPFQQVLAETQTVTRIFSPTDLTKSILGALVLLLFIVLLYDLKIARKKNLVRISGKNSAHLLLMIVLAVILVTKHGGMLL